MCSGLRCQKKLTSWYLIVLNIPSPTMNNIKHCNNVPILPIQYAGQHFMLAQNAGMYLYQYNIILQYNLYLYFVYLHLIVFSI